MVGAFHAAQFYSPSGGTQGPAGGAGEAGYGFADSKARQPAARAKALQLFDEGTAGGGNRLSPARIVGGSLIGADEDAWRLSLGAASGDRLRELLVRVNTLENRHEARLWPHDQTLFRKADARKKVVEVFLAGQQFYFGDDRVSAQVLGVDFNVQLAIPKQKRFEVDRQKTEEGIGSEAALARKKEAAVRPQGSRSSDLFSQGVADRALALDFTRKGSELVGVDRHGLTVHPEGRDERGEDLFLPVLGPKEQPLARIELSSPAQSSNLSRH